MKNKFVKAGLAILSVISLCWIGSERTSELSSLALDNIEALAQSESEDMNIRCYDSGDLDCHGMKVRVIYSFSVEPEEK